MSKLLSLFSRGGSHSSTDAIRQSTSMTMAYLLEQNRKFESFMRQKVEELEGRVSAQQQTRQDLEYEDEADYDHEIDRVEEADQDRSEPTAPAPITSADVDEPFGPAVAPLSAMATARPMDGGTDDDATRKTVVVSGQPGLSPDPLPFTPEDLTETGSSGAEDGQSETSTDAPLPEESLTGDELPENELEASLSPAPEPDIPAEDMWLVMLGGEALTTSPRQPTSLVISEWNASAEAEGNEEEPAYIEDNRSEVETRQSELAEPETDDESVDCDTGEEGSIAAEAIAESAEHEATKAEMTEPEPEDEPSEEEFREAWPTAEITDEPEADEAEMTEPQTAGETENERVTDAARKSIPTVGIRSQIKMSGNPAEEEEDSDSLLPPWVTAQLKN